MFKYLEIETTVINKPPRAVFKIVCDVNNDRLIVSPLPKKNTQVKLHIINDSHIKQDKYISETYPIYLPLDCDNETGLYKITQSNGVPLFDLFTIVFNVCYELGIGKICHDVKHDDKFIYLFEIDEIQLTTAELMKLENYLYSMEYIADELTLELQKIIMYPKMDLGNTFKVTKFDCSKINELIECKEEY